MYSGNVGSACAIKTIKIWNSLAEVSSKNKSRIEAGGRLESMPHVAHSSTRLMLKWYPRDLLAPLTSRGFVASTAYRLVL